jgi:hypothetical protein
MVDEEKVYVLHYNGERFQITEHEAKQLKAWNGTGRVFTIQREETAVHLAIGSGIPFVIKESTKSADQRSRRVTVL